MEKKKIQGEVGEEGKVQEVTRRPLGRPVRGNPLLPPKPKPEPPPPRRVVKKNTKSEIGRGKLQQKCLDKLKEESKERQENGNNDNLVLIETILSPAQVQAITLLLQGNSIQKVADELGYCRSTISRWINVDEAFAAELARQRAEQYTQTVQKALGVMDDMMESKDNNLKFKAGNSILRHHALISVRSGPTTVRLEGLEKIRGLLREDASERAITAEFTEVSNGLPDSDEDDD